MITIKSPKQYINKENILSSAGEYISKIGKRAIVIGGRTAVSTAGDLFKGLDAAGIAYEIKEFTGNVTLDAINKYSLFADEFKADLIIGVGGGRVLDLTKAAGNKKHIPVVAVPTIAATCAAWSALSIIYDEDGRFSEALILDASPELVLADTKILAQAPVKYLVAGIGDTLAKWYEAAPSFHEGESDISLQLGLSTSKLALELLNRHALDAVRDIKSGRTSQRFGEVVDAIILLAGFVGGVNGGSHRAAVGHAFYNALTHHPETSIRLHGDKVSFGLIVQFILEGKPESEVLDSIRFFDGLGLPITLAQLGIKGEINDKVSQIAKDIKIPTKSKEKLRFKIDQSLVENAIITADKLGRLIESNSKKDEKIA